MDLQQVYKSKRVKAAEAVSQLCSDTDVAMGMAISEPPALLEALAERVRSGELTRTHYRSGR